MGVWNIRLAPAGVWKVFALTELPHPQQTCFVKGCPHYTHKYCGDPETLASFFLARKSSLEWGCRLRTHRPEELDETWFQLLHGSRALISSPHGVVIKLKLLRRTSYSLNWFVSHPSLCLSTQILSIKCWKCFYVDELTVLSPEIALIWLFWDFDKLEGFHELQISTFIWLSKVSG